MRLGEDQFAALALGHGLERVGVEALDDEMVFLDVHARAGDAFAADAGADDLGQAVVVEGQEAELALDLDAHVLGPGLAAEVGELQAQAARVDALLAGDLGDVQGVAGRADQHVGLRSWMSMIWRGVLPPAAGTTAAPTRSTP